MARLAGSFRSTTAVGKRRYFPDAVLLNSLQLNESASGLICMLRRRFLQRTSFGFVAYSLGNTSSVHAAAPKPRLTVKGDLLAELPFKDLETDGWSKGRGRWRVEKGEVFGEQIDPEPLYHAHIWHDVAFGSAALIEAEVKLDGANSCWLNLGHVGAVSMSESRIGIWEDDAELKNTSGLPAADGSVRRGKWVPILIELAGVTVAAERDGVALGAEATVFKNERKGIGFGVYCDLKNGKGRAAGLRNLKIWQATPNEKWKLPKTPRLR